MTDSQTASPLAILRDIEQRSRANAAPLPRREEGGRLWTGIGFLLGNRRYVVPLGEVIEILPIPALTKVPGVKGWVRGVANVRGSLMPIIDLPGFLGRTYARFNKRNRVMVLDHDGVLSGVVVEEVLGLQHFRDEERLSGEMRIEKSVQEYVEGGFTRDGETWTIFSLYQLARDKSFLQVAS